MRNPVSSNAGPFGGVHAGPSGSGHANNDSLLAGSVNQLRGQHYDGNAPLLATDRVGGQSQGNNFNNSPRLPNNLGSPVNHIGTPAGNNNYGNPSQFPNMDAASRSRSGGLIINDGAGPSSGIDSRSRSEVNAMLDQMNQCITCKPPNFRSYLPFLTCMLDTIC